jgi:hypothetical protein
MKRKFLSIIAGACLAITPISATGYPVFDVSGWLTAIDQLYQQYDMVMNTITQIENQYNMIQQNIERAKSIDWDSIQFDGDFDIRNDIRDANKRVNRLLTSSRNIKSLMTSPSIQCGYGSYSLADLCGMNGAEHNFFAACTDTEKYMTDSMEYAVKAITEGLTTKQKRAIWAKYGIGPKNYIFVQQSVAQVKSAASKVMAKVTEEARNMKREEDTIRKNNILKAAYESLDSDGNITEGAANEAQLQLTGELVDRTSDLTEAVEDMANVTASKMIADENQKQSEADEIEAQQRMQEAIDKRVPDYFKK